MNTKGENTYDSIIAEIFEQDPGVKEEDIIDIAVISTENNNSTTNSSFDNKNSSTQNSEINRALQITQVDSNGYVECLTMAPYKCIDGGLVNSFDYADDQAATELVQRSVAMEDYLVFDKNQPGPVY